MSPNRDSRQETETELLLTTTFQNYNPKAARGTVSVLSVRIIPVIHDIFLRISFSNRINQEHYWDLYVPEYRPALAPKYRVYSHAWLLSMASRTVAEPVSGITTTHGVVLQIHWKTFKITLNQSG